MLAALLEKYPLPPGWATPEHFNESLDIESSVLHLSGLCAVGPEGEPITGSAASVGASESATVRSYFELQERISVMEAMSLPDVDLELRDSFGNRCGRARRCDVFAKSNRPDRWRPSRSNGVALHATWTLACGRAGGELCERDRVLRSWYGESSPTRCVLPETLIPQGLRSLATWNAYEVGPGAAGIGKALTVSIVVGVPAAETTPLTYGFAAHIDRQGAMEAALAEAVQRFGFLFGEEIPHELPALSPAPDFHQEFFLFPPSHKLLTDWLEGGSGGSRDSAVASTDSRSSTREDAPRLLFVDLTPKHLRGSLCVAKAVCPSAEPLVFGEPAPHRADTIPSRRVHPVA